MSEQTATQGPPTGPSPADASPSLKDKVHARSDRARNSNTDAAQEHTEAIKGIGLVPEVKGQPGERSQEAGDEKSDALGRPGDEAACQEEDGGKNIKTAVKGGSGRSKEQEGGNDVDDKPSQREKKRDKDRNRGKDDRARRDRERER